MTNATMPIAQPVHIGDVVFVVTAGSYGSQRVPCPVCFGQLFVTVILGNGEHVTVECDGCGLGFDGPQGTITVHAPFSRVDTMVVDGLSRCGDGWQVSSQHRSARWGVDAFATSDEAEARRVVLHAEAERDAEDRTAHVTRSKQKKVGWLVRYHTQELKRAERDVAHHTEKLSDAKSRRRAAPTPSSEPPK